MEKNVIKINGYIWNLDQMLSSWIVNSAIGKGSFMVRVRMLYIAIYYSHVPGYSYIALRMHMALHKPKDCMCLNHSTLLDTVKGNL